MHVENIIIVKSNDNMLIKELTKELQTFYPYALFTFTNTEIRYTGYIGKSASTNIKEINAKTVYQLYMHTYTQIYRNYTYSSHYQYLILRNKSIFRNHLLRNHSRLSFLIRDPYDNEGHYSLRIENLENFYNQYTGGNL